MACMRVRACTCAYLWSGSEHGPDLQVEKSRLCKGMGGERVEYTVHGSDLQAEENRATHAGMNDMLCGEQRCLQV